MSISDFTSHPNERHHSEFLYVPLKQPFGDTQVLIVIELGRRKWRESVELRWPRVCGARPYDLKNLTKIGAAEK